MRKRVLAGILITLVIFVVARRLSMNRPSEVEWTGNGIRITHMTVYEQVGPGQPEIILQVEPPTEIDAKVLYRLPGEMAFETVGMSEISKGVWSARLPAKEKGDRLDYGFRLSRTAFHEQGGSSTLTDETGYYLIKYKGEVSVTVLILHILCMFAAFFFIVEAIIGAFAMLFFKDDKEFTVAQTRWVLLFTFLGGVPLGMALNWQRFGGVGGVPVRDRHHRQQDTDHHHLLDHMRPCRGRVSRAGERDAIDRPRHLCYRRDRSFGPQSDPVSRAAQPVMVSTFGSLRQESLKPGSDGIL